MAQPATGRPLGGTNTEPPTPRDRLDSPAATTNEPRERDQFAVQSGGIGGEVAGTLRRHRSQVVSQSCEVLCALGLSAHAAGSSGEHHSNDGREECVSGHEGQPKVLGEFVTGVCQESRESRGWWLSVTCGGCHWLTQCHTPRTSQALSMTAS